MGELLFGTFRGLFLISPFLIFSIPGLVLMWRKKPEQRSIVFLISIVILGFLGYGSGYIVWWGGYSVGARLLIPMLPFMAFPIIFVFNQWFSYSFGRIVIGLFILAALLNTWAQSIVAYGLPPDVPQQLLTGYHSLIDLDRQVILLVGEGKTVNPLLDFAIPALQKGIISYNYGMALGLKGFASFLPLIALVGIILSVGWYFLNRDQREVFIQPAPA